MSQAARQKVGPESGVTVAQRVKRIHEEGFLIDMAWATNPARITPPISGQSALDRAVAAGITGAAVTVADYHDDFRKALWEMNKVHLLRETHPDQVVIVEGVGDLQAAKREGKFGIITHFQTGTPLEGDWPNTLRVLYRLGLRVLQLTYNERNLLGDGCFEPDDRGLTGYGVQVVRALNSFGVILDVAHAGPKTAIDAIRASSLPVICSHANAAALTPHPRNLSDDLIRAVRDSGGVVGATAVGAFCAIKGSTAGGISDYLDHIDYLVNLAGPEHVGIGSDIGEDTVLLPVPSDYEVQYGALPVDPATAATNSFVIADFDRLEKLTAVTAGLLERGYRDGVVANILGGNFLRVAQQVWS